jgi:hypothetical protein
MHHRKTVPALAVLLGTGCLWAGSAQAVLYGNPTKERGQGNYSVGFSTSDHTREMDSDGLGEDDVEFNRGTFNVGIGVGSGGEIGLHLGAIQLDGYGLEDEGGDYGLSYHHEVEFLDGVEEEVFLSYRYSYIYFDDNDNDLDMWQYDVGYSVGKEVQEGLSLYGGGVLSRLDAAYYAYYSYDLSSTGLIGAFGGIEYQPDPQVALGLEAHLIAEQAFGGYVEYRF